MRLWKSLLNDIRFQYKYGIYLVYAIITCVYIILISVLPSSIQNTATAIIVFTDPSALGIFFIGAIVLFEKSERVLHSVFISPLSINEYIFSKVCSLAIISLIVAVIITVVTAKETIQIGFLIVGVFLGSIFFSLIGLIIASFCRSINQYIISSVLISTVIFIPFIAIVFGYNNLLLDLYPVITVSKLIFRGFGLESISGIYILPLVIWTAVIWKITYHCIKRMIKNLGGIKL